MDQNRPEEMRARKAPDKRKMLIIAAVIVAVVLVAVGVDYAVRNPPCKDEVAALNVIIQKVLMAVDEIGEEDPFSMEVMDPEVIGGKEHFVISLTNEKTGESVEVGRYYVRASNSKVYVKDAAGKLVPFAG